MTSNECVLWVLSAILSLTCGQFPDSEYCSVPCQRGLHTLCAYKDVGPKCETVKNLMNQNGRMKILSLHNSFRNALAGGELKTTPMSSNMRQLYWDLELEAIAERWAMQCNASYNDECRDVNRFKVGQIISKSKIRSPKVKYYDALLTKNWFSEVEKLDEATISNYRQQRNVKHVAQILSASTTRIGCADVLYTTVKNDEPVRVTVCNYGPLITSNDPIYRIGEPCSQCPQRTACRGDDGQYPRLCTELRQFDVVEPEKSFDTVQREYEDEGMDEVAIESQIFSKENEYQPYNPPKHRPGLSSRERKRPLSGGRGLYGPGSADFPDLRNKAISGDYDALSSRERKRPLSGGRGLDGPDVAGKGDDAISGDNDAPTAGDPPEPEGGPPTQEGGPTKAAGDPHKAEGDPSKAEGDPPKAEGDPPKPAGDPPEPTGDPPKPGGRQLGTETMKMSSFMWLTTAGAVSFKTSCTPHFLVGYAILVLMYQLT